MAKANKTTTETMTTHILPVSRGSIEFAIIGMTPLIMNTVSQKTKQELLFPKPRKTQADRAQSMKHDPLTEFRAAAYKNLNSACQNTRLMMPSPAFKGAMAIAALDIPGATKSAVGRQIWVEDYSVDVYGIPEMLMSIVKMADIKRTPDVRTRPILRQWACRITINFMTPIIDARSVTNLLAAAGFICGIGDFRQEKGKGNYGQFAITDAKADKTFQRILATGGTKAQDAALLKPTFFDSETEELYSWFEAETKVRGKNATSSAATPSIKMPPPTVHKNGSNGSARA